MHEKKSKHFSFYIGAQLLSVFTVLVVAFSVGYVSKGSHINFHGLLAQTLMTSSSSGSLPEITFSVLPTSLMKCELDFPRTQVIFAVSDASNGEFLLASNTASAGLHVSAGDYYFPNGTYHWSAVVKSGYIGSGVLYGEFVLNSACPTTSTASTGALTTTTTTTTTTTSPTSTLSTTTTASPILNTTTFPEIWQNGNRFASGGTVSDSPIIKIYVPTATHVSFELDGTTISQKIFTDQNGVIRLTGTNVWSVDLAPVFLPDGAYKVRAFFETNSGTYYTSETSFNIQRIQNTTIATTNTVVVQPATIIEPTTTLEEPKAPSPVIVPVAVAPTAIVAPPTVISSTFPSPAPLLTVFIENTPVIDREHAFSHGEIEFRIKAPLFAKRVTLFAASSSQVELGRAVRDDLLSNEKFDIWSFIWNVESVASGSYKVFARVITLDNHFPETAPLVMSIVHETPVIPSPTAQSTLSSRMNDETNIERQEEILSRVTAPALCMNREECQVYCASHPEEKEHCTLFARTMLDRSTEMLPSLADGIDPLRIQIILDNQKRSKEIPEEVSTPEKLKDFCAELSHADACAKVLVRNDLANETMLNAKKELLAQIRNEEEHIFVERIGARIFIDSDKDGIADYDEVNIYHTDPNNQDTDHDGFPDGAEVIVHTNPLGGRSAETGTTTATIVRDEHVKLENPRISGAIAPTLLTTEEVSLVQTSLSENGHASSSALVFRGHATSNSFITLYIFSDPIVVTIKTDESGAWTYTLDKALADGSHEIYSAITDSGGHILAKSEPLPFVKEAQAVSFGSAALLPGNTEPGFFSGASLYAFIAIIIGMLGIAFSIIGFIVRRRDVENIPIDEAP